MYVLVRGIAAAHLRSNIRVLSLAAACIIAVMLHASASFNRTSHLEVEKPQLELRVHASAIYSGKEGLGAILAKLRGVLILANATGAAVTQDGRWRRLTDHGYPSGDFLRVRQPLSGPRRYCALTGEQYRAYEKAYVDCDQFDTTVAQRLFRNCDTVNFTALLPWVRGCAAYTAPFVRALWRPPLPVAPKKQKKDVCVLRRGGDIERHIDMDPKHMSDNFRPYAVHRKRTLPVLEAARRAGRRVVLITQTKDEPRIKKVFHPDVFSNNEPLHIVLQRAARCRCLFITAGSSFAHVVVQLARPALTVYTHSEVGWRLGFTYAFEDFGKNAMSITVPVDQLVQHCVYE